ncbi:MAG: acyl-CoA dehydrogenase family protein [Bacillota bacterium]|nr:acyl-CoA dehydrogenase family protein [Bacillota bacterium]
MEIRQAAQEWVRRILAPREDLRWEHPLPEAAAKEILALKKESGFWALSLPEGEGGAGLSLEEEAAFWEEAHTSPLGLYGRSLLLAGEVPFPLQKDLSFVRETLKEGRRTVTWLLSRPFQEGPHPVLVPSRWDWLFLWHPAEGGVLLSKEGALLGKKLEPTMGSSFLLELRGDEQGDTFPPREEGDLWVARQQILLAAGALGAARRSLLESLPYTQTRQTFKAPLSQRQAIQWLLAASAKEMETARALLGQAFRDPLSYGSLAKAWAVDVALRAVDRTIQIFGGSGYTKELPYEEYWRELRLYRHLLGDHQEVLKALGQKEKASLLKEAKP